MLFGHVRRWGLRNRYGHSRTVVVELVGVIEILFERVSVEPSDIDGVKPAGSTARCETVEVEKFVELAGDGVERNPVGVVLDGRLRRGLGDAGLAQRELGSQLIGLRERVPGVE